MAVKRQPLDQFQPIVIDSGRPNLYFIRYMQQAFDEFSNTSNSVTTITTDLEDLQSKDIVSADGSITITNGSFGVATDADLSVDEQVVLDSISTTQGSILYRNATDWVALTPGTAGYVLTTNGAGANPSWAAGGGGGDIQTLLDGISTTRGVLLYYDGTDWNDLAPGTAGQVLRTGGAGADPYWSDVDGGDVWGTLSPSAAIGVVNSNVAGFVLDFTDPAQLWQESTQTTQVSAPGDPVGYVEDLSSWGRDFEQTVAGSRSTWTTWNTFPCVQFDGTDDAFRSVGNLTMYDNGAMTFVIALAADELNDKYIYGEGRSSSNNPIYGIASGTASIVTRVGQFYRNNSNSVVVNHSSINTGTGALNKYWEVLTFRDTGTGMKWRRNGGAWTSEFSYSRSATTVDRAGIGCVLRASASNFYAGYIGRIAACGAALSDSDCSILEEWCANGVGVTLG